MERTIKQAKLIGGNAYQANRLTEIRLHPGQPLSMEGDQRGRTIRSVSGYLWISQYKDPVDHVLNPGEAFQIDKRGRVVLESFNDSRAVLK